MNDDPTLWDAVGAAVDALMEPEPKQVMENRDDAILAAAKARDKALERVEEHADPDWKDVALDAVRQTAQQLETFISDDVWVTGALPQTREDRALGPVLLRAARLGWCVKTDRVRPSVRSHLSGKPVWRSLIWRLND